MHRLAPVRLVTAVALVVTGSVAAGAFTTPASAAAPKTTCAAVSISVKGVGTLSKCGGAAYTGGSGQLVVNIKKSPYPATVTWKGTGTTTASLKYAGLPKGGKNVCPAGTSEIVVTGTVTGGTGKAVASIPKGSKVAGNLCYKVSTSSLSLAPNNVLTI